MTPRYGRWKEHPCRQDCPQRRAGCHAECRAYRDYEADKRRRYAAAERPSRPTSRPPPRSGGPRRDKKSTGRETENMDRENELILSGIGACPYCGQAVAVDRREGETPADAAARVCDCIGAR